MINEPIQIINLKTLRREKQRLKMFCSYEEQLIQEKIVFIKSNYSQIIGEEFLPYNTEKNRKISNYLDLINEFLVEKLLGKTMGGKNKFPRLLAKVIQIIVIRIFDSFLNKKT